MIPLLTSSENFFLLQCCSNSDVVPDEMPSVSCTLGKGSIEKVSAENSFSEILDVFDSEFKERNSSKVLLHTDTHTIEKQCAHLDPPTDSSEREHPNEKQSLKGKKQPEMAAATRRYAEVKRTKEMEAQRAKLPIYAEEQVIVETVNENDVGFFAYYCF